MCMNNGFEPFPSFCFQKFALLRANSTCKEQKSGE